MRKRREGGRKLREESERRGKEQKTCNTSSAVCTVCQLFFYHGYNIPGLRLRRKQRHECERERERSEKKKKARTKKKKEEE